MFDIGRSMFDIGGSTFDVGRSMFDVCAFEFSTKMVFSRVVDPLENTKLFMIQGTSVGFLQDFDARFGASAT